VQQIIHDYHTKTAQDFAVADYGVTLNQQEQQRRYVIKSLLEGQYLDVAAYERFFGSNPLQDLPELQQLEALDLLAPATNRLQLNSAGLECSDIIGPWLYSAAVKAKMNAFELQ
jgi:oxygen-independent coproporphyrinogen-3 oxidase